MRTLSIKAALILVPMLLAACSNIDLKAAKELGDKGGAVAKSVFDEATSAEKSFSRDPERIVLRTAIVQGAPAPDLPSFDMTYKVIDLVNARTQAIGALVPVYKSFSDLTQYDAAGETEQAIGGLVDQVNKAATAAAALGAPLALISVPIGELTKIGGGLLAEEEQKQKVEAASKMIRTALERLSQLMAAEKQYAVSLRVENIRSSARLSELLMSKGVASYEDTVKGVLTDLGAKPVKDIDSAMNKDPTLKAGFTALLRHREEQARKDISSAYDALIGLIDKTVQEHKKLEAGRPIDLATIQMWAARFKSYYDRVREAETMN